MFNNSNRIIELGKVHCVTFLVPRLRLRRFRRATITLLQTIFLALKTREICFSFFLATSIEKIVVDWLYFLNFSAIVALLLLHTMFRLHGELLRLQRYLFTLFLLYFLFLEKKGPHKIKQIYTKKKQRIVIDLIYGVVIKHMIFFFNNVCCKSMLVESMQLLYQTTILNSANLSQKLT